jgi:hypothetical protein
MGNVIGMKAELGTATVMKQAIAGTALRQQIHVHCADNNTAMSNV